LKTTFLASGLLPPQSSKPVSEVIITTASSATVPPTAVGSPTYTFGSGERLSSAALQIAVSVLSLLADPRPAPSSGGFVPARWQDSTSFSTFAWLSFVAAVRSGVGRERIRLLHPARHGTVVLEKGTK